MLCQHLATAALPKQTLAFARKTQAQRRRATQSTLAREKGSNLQRVLSRKYSEVKRTICFAPGILLGRSGQFKLFLLFFFVFFPGVSGSCLPAQYVCATQCVRNFILFCLRGPSSSSGSSEAKFIKGFSPSSQLLHMPPALHVFMFFCLTRTFSAFEQRCGRVTCGEKNISIWRTGFVCEDYFKMESQFSAHLHTHTGQESYYAFVGGGEVLSRRKTLGH